MGLKLIHINKSGHCWCYGSLSFQVTIRNLREVRHARLTISSLLHYNDVIMDSMAYQITSLTIVYSTVYSDADQRKHQSSSSLAFVWGIHRGPVNSPHKWPVTRKMFPYDDVITILDGGLCSVCTRGPIFVITQPADALARNGTKPSTGTMLTTKLHLSMQELPL